MQEILKAIVADADAETFANLEVPRTYRAAHILKSEEAMFSGMAAKDKDPRKSVHIGQVPTPDIAPDVRGNQMYLRVQRCCSIQC